jgi:excisionase family DNA binding protein
MTTMIERLASSDRPAPRLLLTPEEAAAELGIGRTRLYRLIGIGAIESMKLGRSRRIPRVCLEEYVERQRCRTRDGVD